MSKSYVRGCAIHRTFNRAVTLHGVSGLVVEHNVAHDVMGHAFFIEDGIETGNTIQYNLGVAVRTSSTLLITDVTPATFWVTNPNNTSKYDSYAVTILPNAIPYILAIFRLHGFSSEYGHLISQRSHVLLVSSPSQCGGRWKSSWILVQFAYPPWRSLVHHLCLPEEFTVRRISEQHGSFVWKVKISFGVKSLYVVFIVDAYMVNRFYKTVTSIC